MRAQTLYRKVPAIHYLHRPEFGSAISRLASTASKLAPVSDFRSSSASSFHRLSGAPEKNQLDPLSERIRPYRFIASAMIRACFDMCDVSTVDFSRNRAPIGGSAASVLDDAACRAGQMNVFRVRGTVNRIAWSTCPAATSS